MVMLNEEEIQKDYERFVELLKPDPRYDAVMEMYKIFGDQLTLAPASGRVYYHNCFPGGYISHVVRVAEISLKLAAFYKTVGGHIDFTKQELIFAALHHDLGKLGDENGPYYLDNDSDWHRKRGELYKQNDQLQYFRPPDRGLMLLQKYQIPLTEKEWLAIKISDGMYSDGNKAYLVNYQPYSMKTNLCNILHWADHISSRVEQDQTQFL
jgi:hypothetical protein